MNTGYQLPPDSYHYSSGYTNITRCKSCSRTGLYWQQHPANCCPICGGILEEVGSAKWEEGEREVVSKFFFGLIPIYRRTGRWILRENT